MHIAALTLGAAWAPPCTIQVVPYSRSDEVTCSGSGGQDGRVAESDTWWSATGDPEFTAASLSAMPGPVTYLVDSCADSWGTFCPQIGRASPRAVGTTVSPARSSGGEPGVGFLTPRLSLPGLLCFFILWETLKPLAWSCRAAGNRNPGDTGPGRPRERPPATFIIRAILSAPGDQAQCLELTNEFRARRSPCFSHIYFLLQRGYFTLNA